MKPTISTLFFTPVIARALRDVGRAKAGLAPKTRDVGGVSKHVGSHLVQGNRWVDHRSAGKPDQLNNAPTSGVGRECK